MAQQDKDPKKTIEPTINLWQAKVTFKVNCSKGRELTIVKNSLLFLIDKESNFLVFRIENDLVCKIHRNILKEDKIYKVF